MRAVASSAVWVHAAHPTRHYVLQSRLPAHLSYQSHRPGHCAELPLFPGCPPPHAAQQNTPAAEPAHIGVSMSAIFACYLAICDPRGYHACHKTMHVKGTSEDGAPGCAADHRLIWLEIVGTSPTTTLRATAVPAVLPHAISNASSASRRRHRPCYVCCLCTSVHSCVCAAQSSHNNGLVHLILICEGASP